MFRVILRLTHSNPSVQQYAVLNIWSSSRKPNFLQQCKDCLNALLKNPFEKDPVCKVSESCCSSRSPTPPTDTQWPLLSTQSPTVNTQYNASVVVIGAGMAGLSAANHLHDNGVHNVTLLEALERPGGRIQSCWFGDSIIELGAPISTPPATNPILEDAFADGFTNLPLNGADPSRGLLLRSDGTAIPYPVTFQVYQTFKQIWAQAHEIENDESGQSKHSVMKFIGSRIEQEIQSFPSSQEVDAARVFHGLASLASVRSNHDNSLIERNDFGDFLRLPGSSLKVPLGYFGEINNLYESLPSDQVHFGKSVVKIKWGGVSDVFPRAIVVCDDGESFEADYVIITIPLGVLKALADCLFCPGLPASKLNAVLKVPMEFTNKIFLKFTQPFWMWKKDCKKTVFDPKSMECREGWLKGLHSIEPVKGSSHVMCLTVTGLQAQCLEYLSDQQIVCDIMTLLKEMSGNKNMPEPIKIKRTSWSDDPCFYGSHSYMGPGVTSKDFYTLASPLPEHSEFCDPVLLFAGEATCPINFGTVKGARSSGVREAERLLQLVRLQEERDDRQAIDCCI